MQENHNNCSNPPNGAELLGSSELPPNWVESLKIVIIEKSQDHWESPAIYRESSKSGNEVKSENRFLKMSPMQSKNIQTYRKQLKCRKIVHNCSNWVEP